jgi:3-oxoacyl-[acyl-carrier protein] reductase
MPAFDLKDKTAIVTGGAHGIGRAIAAKLSAHGARTVIVDINDLEGIASSEQINEACSSGKCSYQHCDVTDFESVRQFCEGTLSKYKKIDILVYNAGWTVAAPLFSMDLSIWQKGIDINLNGAFYFARCCAPSMIENGSGNMIFIGSSTTWTGSGGGLHYSASKAGIIGLVKGISYELLSKGIRANYITPAVIDTPLLRQRYPDDEKTNSMLASQIPVGRIGKPEDIANVALFLASEESGYICGQEIVADGGRILYQHPRGS